MTRPLSRRRAASLALLCLSTFSLACKDDAAKSNDAPAAPVDGDGEDSPAKPEPIPAQPAQPLPEIAPPTTDSAPIAEHGQIVATVQLPTGSQLADLSPIIEKLAPGMSALVRMQFSTLLSQALGVKALSGARLTGPISLIAVDPSLGPKPLAVLVEIEDEAKLREQAQAAGLELRTQDELGLIGPAATVAAAEPYAFRHLSTYPDHTEIVIYPASASDSLTGQIDEFMAAAEAGLAAQGGGQAAAGKEMLEMYAKAFLETASQTDRAVISFTQGQTTLDLHVHLYPVADTTLASFIAAQEPADHALLTKLPASAAQFMLMSGKLQAGAARDALVAFSLESMGSIYGDQLSKDDWKALLDAWMATLDGQVAVAFNLDLESAPAMKLQGLFGTSDSAAMFTAWRAMLAAMVSPTANDQFAEMMGMKVSLDFDEGVLEHDGVSVDRYSTTIDLESLPPEQRDAIERMSTANQVMHLAAFDGYGAMVSVGDEGEAMAGLIDAARGKAPTFTPSASLTTTIATSTAREESVLFFLDLASATPPQAKSKVPFSSLTLAMGTHEGALALRVCAGF